MNTIGLRGLSDLSCEYSGIWQGSVDSVLRGDNQSSIPRRTYSGLLWTTIELCGLRIFRLTDQYPQQHGDLWIVHHHHHHHHHLIKLPFSACWNLTRPITWFSLILSCTHSSVLTILYRISLPSSSISTYSLNAVILPSFSLYVN